ncbi:hypothetical protein HKD37_06G017515 [Glycine soja]
MHECVSPKLTQCYVAGGAGETLCTATGPGRYFPRSSNSRLRMHRKLRRELSIGKDMKMWSTSNTGSVNVSYSPHARLTPLAPSRTTQPEHGMSFVTRVNAPTTSKATCSQPSFHSLTALVSVPPLPHFELTSFANFHTTPSEHDTISVTIVNTLRTDVSRPLMIIRDFCLDNEVSPNV